MGKHHCGTPQFAASLWEGSELKRYAAPVRGSGLQEPLIEGLGFRGLGV